MAVPVTTMSLGQWQEQFLKKDGNGPATTVLMGGTGGVHNREWVWVLRAFQCWDPPRGSTEVPKNRTGI